MVDLQGKFYLIEDLDANFVNACVNKEAYAHHAGDYVKNAYDPQFNVDGVWDKKASDKAEDLNIVLCYELKQEGKAFKSEARAQLSSLLAYRQAYPLLSIG